MFTPTITSLPKCQERGRHVRGARAPVGKGLMQQLLMWVPVADDWSLVAVDWSRRESTLMKAIAVMVITEMQGTPWFFGRAGARAPEPACSRKASCVARRCQKLRGCLHAPAHARRHGSHQSNSSIELIIMNFPLLDSHESELERVGVAMNLNRQKYLYSTQNS